VAYSSPVTVGASTGTSLFDTIDYNHDGVISREEFNQAMQ
jgi:hypothetical protein